MRPTYLANHAHALHLIGTALIGASIACSPATATTTANAPTTITAADYETTAAPAPKDTAPKDTAPKAAPAPSPSQSACRAKSPSLGTVELILTWDGASAKGSLEQIAPSGNVSSLRVQAERYKGMIVADNISETDLTSHAAIVTEKEGKRYMRVGDDNQPWLLCE